MYIQRGVGVGVGVAVTVAVDVGVGVGGGGGIFITRGKKPRNDGVEVERVFS